MYDENRPKLLCGGGTIPRTFGYACTYDVGSFDLSAEEYGDRFRLGNLILTVIEKPKSRKGMQTFGIPLGDVANGRDNNFNLIRFCAAIAVLVSHAWPISHGPERIEPLKENIGHSLGEMAVYVFFALSGFFVAASYERSNSSISFLTARAARLFPGLAISLVLVVFVLGPAVTNLGFVDYFMAPNTASFLFQNLSLLVPQYTLPGVFTDLPYPTVEGSIWTLAHEVACYICVFILGITGVLFSRLSLFIALIGYFSFYAAVDVFHPRIEQFQTLSLPFVLGVILWVWRDWITLSLPILGMLVLLAWLGRETDLAYPMTVLTLTYGVFWLGYAPSGAIRTFNRLGDYSYGIYIYAFPLQGLVVWIWGPVGPQLNILLSLPMVLLCAVASWHIIERPALEFARARVVKSQLLKRRYQSPRHGVDPH
jgi:peptidoglycan/LPS O-acetylase OafA/YrhL